MADNDRVGLTLSVPAGFRETQQVVPNDQIAIRGDARRAGGGHQRSEDRRPDQPGTTFYVPKNAPHQFLNTGAAP